MTPNGPGNRWARLAAVGALAAAMIVASACTTDDGRAVGLPPGQSGGAPTTPTGQPSGPCESGTTRDCRVDLSQQGDVINCYVGTETCVDGAWGPCQDGAIETFDTSGSFGAASLSTPMDCMDNPCDPRCQEFDEIPMTTIEATPDVTFQWDTGATFDPPAGTVREPCQSALDCQANHYCQFPITASCEHSKCELGNGLQDGCDPCVNRICDQDPDCCTVTSSCAALFGSEAGYLYECPPDDPSECKVGIRTQDQSCDDLCASQGATCLGTWDNSGTCGLANSVGCGDTSLFGGICVCTNPNAGVSDGWDQDCVDAVATECQSECDTSSTPPIETGECVHYDPGQTDPNCAGIDLTVDATCANSVPVCNVGNMDAPAGVEIYYWDPGAEQIPLENPDLSTAAGTCVTTEPIRTGRCIAVTSCTGLVPGSEIMVNPPTGTELTECTPGARLNNWSAYDSQACSNPICTDETTEDNFRAVSMYIMMDKSCSMQTNSMWNPASAALKSFFASPDVSGVNLALRFYPDDQPTNGCSSGTCSEDACSDPVVPLAPVTAAAAPIDTQEQALFAALDARSPGGGTPSRVALGGAALAAERRALTNPRDRNVVIFVTDGQPTQCGTNEGDIQDEAGEAFDFYNVLTYAIGLEGVSQAFMDGIAEQGGTGSAFFISNNSTVEQQLLNALLAIQGTPIECNLNLPDINVDPFDPGSTVVTLEPGDGSIAELVQVSDVSQCAMGDWYFDDPVQPTVVTLCPTRCATANNPPSTCTGVGEFESPIDATCYLHDTTGRTFADAEALCEAWGGEVASITSFREQGFLERESGISTETWIGLRDEATEGIFQWTNRDAFSFENWDGGQPNGSTTQNCVAYLNGGVWHDRECTNSYQTLCERKASRSGIKVHLGCANGFTPSTFTEVYEATCPEGQGPQWGFFTYTSTAPAGSSIVFEARGAQTQVDLAAATYQPVATSQSTPVDTTNCALTGPAPTCPVNLFTTLTDVNDEPFLELRATLNPDQRFTPTLSNWQITYTCVPNQ